MSKSMPRVLDVRPILAKGGGPFAYIQEELGKLLPGQALLLRSPFEPTPLYSYMKQQGYDATPQQGETGEWEVLFTPGEKGYSDYNVLDLRHYAPPEPMEKALEAAALLGRSESLTVKTRYRPVDLLDQLEAIGYGADSEECGPHHWETNIWRKCEHL